MADSNIGIERWQKLTGSNYSTGGNYSTGVSRWEELNQAKYTKDIINSHNIFTLATVPLGASREDVYRTKYKGKSFNELNVILRDMDEGEEKDWLTQYTNSPEVMTQKDYENAISIAENQRDWYRRYNSPSADIEDTTVTQIYGREISALDEELERLYAGLYQRENQDKYGSIRENADYGKLSSKVEDDATVNFGNFFRGTADATYDYINDIDGARERNRSMQQKAGGGSYSRYNKYDEMSAEEIADYNYIYQSEGKEAANEYLDWLSYSLDERRIESEKKRAAELATENPFMASAVSVPANLASGVGMIDVALQQAGRAITGNYKPINYNRGAMGANAFSTGVREGVSQNLVDKYGQIEIDSQEHPVLAKLLNGKSWADVYSLGMSMADSGALLLTGLGPAASVLLGGAAGTQAMLEAVERGADDKQALTMGVLAGGFEALFEAIPLGKLEELIQGGAPSLIRAMASQGLTEGLEELGTGIANNVADILIMAENSNYEKDIAAYIESGLSPEEAKKQALLDMAIQLGWDFVGGAVSGGVFGTGGYGLNKINAAVENRSDKPTIAKDMELIQTAAENRLKELGETGDTGKLAKILAKNAAGKRLSAAEKDRLSSSKYGTRVFNELNAANIESGEFASGWAENIGTVKIHAEQYSKGIEKPKAFDAGEAAEAFMAQQMGETRNGQDPETPKEIPGAVAENTQVTETATTPAESRNDNAAASLNDSEGQSLIQPAADSSLYTREPEISAEEAEDIEEQEATVHDADTALALVQDMGKTGANLLDYAKGGVASRYLTEAQIEAAYKAGQTASDTEAKAKDEETKAKATGGTGRIEGTVRGDGVTIGDIDKVSSGRFNAPQKRGYRILSAYAKATGINIVLYNSASPKATEEQKANTGKFDHRDSTMYIDINSGFALGESLDNMGKFALVRTFGHEFVHFIEKYNAAEYNELRRFVFDTLEARGENVAELIEEKRLASGGKMSYDAASREVVAEALTDILPDSNLMQNMAEQHKSVFQSLVDMLKEFLTDIKAYFAELKTPPSREARALREEIDGSIHYLEELVQKYDAIAAKAVENYQSTIAVEETVTETVEAKAEPKTSTSENGYTITDNAEYDSIDVKFPGKPSEAIRNALKSNGFRWNGKRGVWYGKMSHEDAMAIIDKAYEAEKAQAEIISEERREVTEVSTPPQSSAMPTQTIKEEANNGENADNNGTVREPDSDRQGNPQILEGLQTGDVQGDVQGRDALGDLEERGRETVRTVLGADTAGVQGERDDGDSQSSDIRRDDGLSQKETEAKAEELHEAVAEQIEQQSTEQAKGNNFVIDESLNLPSGAKSRFRANVDAIRLIKKLNTEGRNATPSEQEILSKYVGWGGLSEAFGEMTWNRETRKSEMTPKSGWEKEFAELRQLVTDGIITEEEYQAASKSTQNAHYTSVEVIKAMYDGLEKLGFKGGRMLEPSAGVGNFVGAMPARLSKLVKSWTMVELDRITGQIAKYLYPNSDVRIQGFETANIPDNYMDVAIGNVPFGNYGLVDKAYPKRITKAIHNYFFAKSLDKVRTGGIVMFITSSFTMNGSDNSVRQYIMDRADLLGAIRLPNNAFAGNAGTQVVTDILILKKRAAGTAYAGEAFLEAPYTNISGYQGANINEYFNNHPEMVLGTPVFARGMYGANTLTYNPLSDKGSLGEQIGEAFKYIKGQMDYQTKPSPEKANFAVERAGKKSKNGNYVVQADGSIAKNENGTIVPVKTDAKTAKRIAGLVGIKDAYNKLANYLLQNVESKYIQQARKALNAAYDSFVKEHGYINSPANRKAIADDPNCYAIYALEKYDAETKTGTKADIFTKDTISPNRTVTHVEDIASGIVVSINQTGGVDPALIAKLLGSTEEAVTRQLIDGRLAFKTRDGGFEAPARYLSGNVRAKLREAEALAPMDKDFENNVEELKKVIPADIPYHDIHVTPGAPWIPTSVYADFIAEMLGGYNSESSYRGPDVVVGKSNQGDFKIVVNNARLKQSYLNTQKWGTKRRSFLELIDAMMASRSITVNDQIEDPLTGKKRAVINKVETAAAQEKAEEIAKEFQDWLWRDEGRRNELSTLYNEVFNALVTPKYDGSGLTVNGQNPHFSLRPHQADAVQRIISSGGNTLLAHKVGAGKTLEMAAAAMKLRELGIVKKPLFVVPKSLVAQWGGEFMDYYPAAKLLVADEKSFTKANRKTFANRIANGDYDAIIISYEQFEKIPMSVAFQQRFYEEQINEIIDAIAEEKAETKGKGLTVKEMEKKKAQLEKKIAELTTKTKDEDNIDFEQLGIDSVFVDEAHNFKNLQYVSRMNNISGLGNKDGSQRAFDLYTKVRYLQQLNGGRGIVFATATPVMNSMAEMYIMQKYLQSDMLDKLGLKSFDAWAKQFGEVVNSVEIKPSGQGFRVKQTFSNFKNLNELQLLFRSFSDVLTKVPGLKVPKMKGGGVKVVVCEPGQFQKDYMLELEKRADNVKSVDPSVDNMLKITSDGRKVAYTQRMIDPTLPYEPGCKIYRCCENVLAEYKDSKKIKGTQIIFCDMATPKGKSKTANATEAEDDTEFDVESAKLYDDMRAYLVKKGIPAKEISFIHEADTDAKKKKLFADVNEGKVRVLIGSTGKMGVGMNAQKRIVAIHHLDAPWRPGDVEQRDGRAFRQGNINDEVTKYTYVTEGSFDARLWDILDRKQHFINQIMNGEDVGRTAEDTGDVTLSAAEVKALASGNPLIEEHVKLTNELQKLENLQQAHKSNITRARTKLQDDEKNIALLTTRTANLKEDIKARKDTYSEGKFSITIGGQKYTDKKDAGIALIAEIKAKASEENYTAVGSFAGFELRVIKQGHEYSGLLYGKQGYTFNVYVGNTTYGINHLISLAEGLEERLKSNEQKLKDLSTDRDAQQQILAEPFTRQAELEQKRARFNEIMAILNPKEEQVISDDETVQYQPRIESLSDREVLTMAQQSMSEEIDLDAAESDALRIISNRLGKLGDLEAERREAGQLYRQQQFGPNVDREAAKATLERMNELDKRITEAENDVLRAENTEVLKKVLRKARQVIEAADRVKTKEAIKRMNDRRDNSAAIKKYRARIRADVNTMSDWVRHPGNKDVLKHVPDVLKDSVIPFITSIDFTSKRQLGGGAATKADEAFVKQLEAVKKALNTNANVNGLYSGYSDLPPNFNERLEQFIEKANAIANAGNGEYIINRMTSEELKALSEIVRNLKQLITDFNLFHANAMYQHVEEAGDNSVEYMSGMKNAGMTNGATNFVLWQNMRPAYAFERFGKGGEAIYDGLRRGQAQLAFNTKKIVEFAKKAYTKKEVNDWAKEVKTFTIDGEQVKIPVSYIMGLYELSKRPQALTHILGDGIRIATFKSGAGKISDTGHVISQKELQTIISSLTPRQKEVADALQKYMAEQGGKWGNHVSVKRWGEEVFGEEHYYPINSDGRHLSANADEKPGAASLYALLNMSFTKELQEGANNRIIVYDIFDVFSNHMASMAQYNALALPVLDAVKWFNYKQKNEAGKVIGSVREQMDRVYGVPVESKPGKGKQGYAQGFVENVIKAFNGTEAQGVPTDEVGLKALRRYNMAQVATNVRVIIQQPLAITRAALLVDYDSIIKGMKPQQAKQNIEEMRKYSGIAAWKSLGFYDVNISRGVTSLIKHDTDWRDTVNDIGMKGAEVADTLTWAGIWSACKEQIKKTRRLKPGDKGFYEAVTELFEDVIYKTQVVDSVLTKSEYSRSKGFFTRATASFMSEPITTASMLLSAVDKYMRDVQQGKSRAQAWKENRGYIVRVAYVYGVGAILLSAVQAVADAFRDDDEYQNFWEKWGEAFVGNVIDELAPFNKLPIISDFYDLAKELLSIMGVNTYGNPPQSVFMQWYDSLVKGTEIIWKKIHGNEDNYTWYGGAYKLLQAASGIFGLPMAAATREVVTFLNNTVGRFSPSLRIRSYKPSETAQIKNAYKDGWLTAEEATKELIEKGLADNEDEAYWYIQEWESGDDSYSRYDAIYEAVRNGGDFKGAMKELTDHGYTVEQVKSQVRSQIGTWYKEREISKQQAVNMLSKYIGMDSEEITKLVNEWSAVVVTGIAYDDIKDEYLAGNITATRAAEMYVRYGGMSKEKATAVIEVYDWHNQGYDYATEASIRDYKEYCQSSNVPKDVYLSIREFANNTENDKDANGKSINYSAMKKIMAEIDSYDLTAEQKTAIARSLGWSEKNIKKYKLW